MSGQPWTFEPLEICPRAGWEIYDPNLAQVVAVFYDHQEAEDFLRWRNKKQTKRRDAYRRRRQARSELAEKLRVPWA